MGGQICRPVAFISETSYWIFKKFGLFVYNEICEMPLISVHFSQWLDSPLVV
jgi:hypothetical protein